MKQLVDFGPSSADIYPAVIAITDVDFETTQNIDLKLPSNFKFKVDKVESVVRTAPSGVTTKAQLGLAEFDGTTATEVRGDVDLEAATESMSDILFSAQAAGGGYVYYQNIAAATTSGLCTQNTALDSAGNIAGETDPDVPRKLVITTVDNAGDDLAGTVTLTGKNVAGEKITEVVTIVAGTDSHTTNQVFATFDEGSFDFGATATVTVDTLDIGGATAVGLPAVNAVPFKIVAGGSEEAASSTDPDEGAVIFTTAPNGIVDYEIWYRTFSNAVVLDGGNFLRLAVTGGTVTGSDVRDVFVHLIKY